MAISRGGCLTHAAFCRALRGRLALRPEQQQPGGEACSAFYGYTAESHENPLALMTCRSLQGRAVQGCAAVCLHICWPSEHHMSYERERLHMLS